MPSRVREGLERADERPDPSPEIARPPHVEAVLRMQATAGNQATSRLIARDEAAPAEKTAAHVLAIEAIITSLQHSNDPRLDEPLITVGCDGKSLEFE